MSCCAKQWRIMMDFSRNRIRDTSSERLFYSLNAKAFRRKESGYIWLESILEPKSVSTHSRGESMLSTHWGWFSRYRSTAVLKNGVCRLASIELQKMMSLKLKAPLTAQWCWQHFRWKTQIAGIWFCKISKWNKRSGFSISLKTFGGEKVKFFSFISSFTTNSTWDIFSFYFARIELLTSFLALFFY